LGFGQLLWGRPLTCAAGVGKVTDVVPRTWKTPVSKLGAVLLGAAVLFSASAQGSGPKDTLSVLALYGFDPFAPVVVEYDASLRATLAAIGPQNVTIHNEVLDLEALGDPVLAPKQRAWFQARYGVYRPAAVVAVGAGPLAFALQVRQDFWPDIPILYSGVDEDVLAQMQLPAGVTGVARRPAVDQTLALALALLPDTERVVLIGGAADVDRAFEVSARPDIARVTGHLEQIDLTGLPLMEMGERLTLLPPHSIVFGISLFRDGTGRSIRGTEAVGMLSQWSSAPIFTTHTQLLGLGVVGGWVTDPKEVGRETALQLSRVLSAPPGTPLPAAAVAPVRPAVDARQLSRWGIPESRVPASTEVYFRQVPLWRRYFWPIAAILGALLLESGLIAFLLMERRWRHVAEAEARANQERIAHINRVGTVAELSGSLAHELSGPLGAIVNNARAARRLLMGEAPDLKEVRASLVDIEGSAERASQVIGRLRTVLRKDEFRATPVDLTNIVQDAVKLVSSEAARRKVALDLALTPGLPTVQGDAVLLLQVLLNLLLNALDAVAEQPLGRRSVTVRARPKGGAVELSVSDSGHGLPQSAQEAIFEPFFTTKSKGLGMGLAICRSIAEAHSGSITAESRAEGGAIFRLTLPATSARQEAAA
jgi:signal transduction histidine kinase